MESHQTYYQLLGLEHRQYESSLSSQEVKSAYRRALLQHHPDKAKSELRKAFISVDDIALAYKTLSEPDLRAEYDRWLHSNNRNDASGKGSLRPHHTGLETVDLDDLSFDSESSNWSRGCRCGDDRGYLVTETELEKNIEECELIVGCKGCSLWLRVLFGVEP